MPRIVSVWLESWPIARFLTAQGPRPTNAPADGARPFVLTEAASGGPRVYAASRTARRGGVTPGEPLASARVKVAGLEVHPADPAADALALRRLGLWALRYTPLVAAWGEAEGGDGLFLDIAGCAHLFGGEDALLADLGARLAGFGLSPRLAIASTPGAAWALARYGGAATRIVPAGVAGRFQEDAARERAAGVAGRFQEDAARNRAAGAEAEALAELPPAALRLPEEVADDLGRLGFRRIRALFDQPRAPFARRFGPELFSRLDQALGRTPEPLALLFPPPAYRAFLRFPQPVAAEAPVAAAAARLFGTLAPELARDRVGARRLCLRLFRLDGAVEGLEFGLAAPCRDGAHVARMVALRLERLAQGLDAGLGFEAASLTVLAAEPMPERQRTLLKTDTDAEAGDLTRLIDTLEERLGAGSVTRLTPRASHLPERAVLARRAGLPAEPPGKSPGGKAGPEPAAAPAAEWPHALPARPVLLFPHPEPAEVTALVPEGPPRQFRWRGRLFQVAAAEGPERIAPEWWREAARTRDYYRVEDDAGRRFWLYRAGGYEGDGPRWFLHGLFA